MKAAVLREVKTPLVIEDVPISKPKSREVPVRTAACGACHSDLHDIEDKHAAPLPAVLGSEAARSGVRHSRSGDHAIACPGVFCGHCEYCTTGRPFSCRNPEVSRDDEEPRPGNGVSPFFTLSAFAEMMPVHEHALVKIRNDMPFDRAALTGCGVTTGSGAVINTAKIEIGCGGVALSAINGTGIAPASGPGAIARPS